VPIDTINLVYNLTSDEVDPDWRCHVQGLPLNFEAISLVQTRLDKAGEEAAAEHARELKTAGKSAQNKKYVIRGIFFLHQHWWTNSLYKAELDRLEAEHVIIRTPWGHNDDHYSIGYALLHKTFVITNDNFYDHVRSGIIRKEWRDTHLVKSKFVRMPDGGGMVWQPVDNRLTLWIEAQMRAHDAGAH
jgi:hypothetical protein